MAGNLCADPAEADRGGRQGGPFRSTAPEPDHAGTRAEERTSVRLVEEMDGVLHFRVRRLEVGKMSAEEKAEAVKALETALEMLRS